MRLLYFFIFSDRNCQAPQRDMRPDHSLPLHGREYQRFSSGPIIFGGARPLLGHLAARAFGEPSRAFPVVVRCLHSSTASFDQNESTRHGF